MNSKNMNRSRCSYLALALTLASLTSILPNSAMAFDAGSREKPVRTERRTLGEHCFEKINCSLCGDPFAVKRQNLRSNLFDEVLDSRKGNSAKRCDRCSTHKHFDRCDPSTHHIPSWCRICKSLLEDMRRDGPGPRFDKWDLRKRIEPERH